MKVNGKINLTFDHLYEVLGLPDGVSVEMVTCAPDEMATGCFTVHLFTDDMPELQPMEAVPVIHDFMLALTVTREERHKAVGTIMELYRKMEERYRQLVARGRR